LTKVQEDKDYNLPEANSHFMLVDKITLKDIGLFDSEESLGIISYLNFCKTNGGKLCLDQFLSNPLSSVTSIEQRQDAIKQFIKEITFIQEMKITNGTTLVMQKFFETGFKKIPTQISFVGAYWYQFFNASDYSLIRYSVEHLILFYKHLGQWVTIFDIQNGNPIVAALIDKIKKYTSHPTLVQLNDQNCLKYPQKLLCLSYFFLYQYKNNTLELLNYFYELDAYYSMARAAQKYHFVFPTWLNNETPSIEVVSAIHPLVVQPVENSITLTQNSNLLFLTGANMAGKSTFIKTIAIVIYLAHIGIGAPAKKVNLTLFDGLISNLNIADNVVKGESYFFNEVQRIKNTIEKIMDGKKYFVLIDELFKGTNVQDAMKCSSEVIKGLQNWRNSLYIISTHLYEISEGLKEYSNIQFNYFETEVRQKELVFHYQLKNGVSQDRLGYLILEREGVVDLLKEITKNKY